MKNCIICGEEFHWLEPVVPVVQYTQGTPRIDYYTDYAHARHLRGIQ